MTKTHLSPFYVPTQSTPVKFQGVGLNALMQGVPTSQRLMGRTLMAMESNQGNAHKMFVQETTTNLIPRYLSFRSTVEAAEVTGLELAESFTLYYALAMLAQNIYEPIFRRLSPVLDKGDKTLLTQPLSKLDPKALERALPAKTAFLLASLATATIGGQYAMIFVKNLLTAKVFKQGEFSEIVNLSSGNPQEEHNDRVVAKAKRRIAQCWGITVGLVALSTLIATRKKIPSLPIPGLKMPRLKIPFLGELGGGQLWRKTTLDKAMESVSKFFDFTYEDIVKNGQRTTNFGFTPKQFLAFAACAGMIGYPDAARDKLERMEVITRVGTFLTYMIFGDKIFNKLFDQYLFQKEKAKFPELFKEGGNTPKALRELPLENLSQKSFGSLLRSKNKLFFIPQLTGIVTITVLLNLINRLWTPLRYRSMERAKAAEAQQAQMAHQGQGFNQFCQAVANQWTLRTHAS